MNEFKKNKYLKSLIEINKLIVKSILFIIS